MKYVLLAIFTLTGDEYVQHRDLTLQHCAGRAAMERMAFEQVLKETGGRIEDMRFECRPEPRDNQHAERLRWRERE